VRFYEVAPTGANWRSGVDLCPNTEFLEKAVPKLLAGELDKFGLSVVDDKGSKRLVANRAFREEDCIGVYTALLFTSGAAVASFMNAGGNAALLDAPLLKVTGLLPTDATPTGVRESVFAVPTGVGRLLCDYRGVRKFPNVRLSVAPGEGPHDGFLRITVRTHNSCGIAAGAVLCCDFGERCRTASSGEIQPAKRFRGALQVFFEEQARVAGIAAGAGVGGGEGSAPPNPAPAPKPAPESPAPKLRASSAGYGSPAGSPAPKAKASKPQPPAPALPASSAGYGSPAGSPADPPGAAGYGSPASAADASGAAGHGSPAGAADARTILKSETDWELAMANGRLMLINKTQQNKRIPPKTLLLALTEGSVEDKPGSAPLAFEFKKSSDIVLTQATAGAGHANATLKDVIKDTQAAALYQHGTFTKAVAPSAFVCKKINHYVPAPGELATCAALEKAAASSTDLTVRWMVTTQAGKIMPTGIALVVAKQVTLPAGAVKAF
jgi:hypothetical protein